MQKHFHPHVLQGGELLRSSSSGLDKVCEHNAAPSARQIARAEASAWVVRTGRCNGPQARRAPLPSRIHTAVSLVAPVVTVVVAIALQFPGDAEPAGAQKALAPSTER